MVSNLKAYDAWGQFYGHQRGPNASGQVNRSRGYRYIAATIIKRQAIGRPLIEVTTNCRCQPTTDEASAPTYDIYYIRRLLKGQEAQLLLGDRATRKHAKDS